MNSARPTKSVRQLKYTCQQKKLHTADVKLIQKIVDLKFKLILLVIKTWRSFILEINFWKVSFHDFEQTLCLNLGFLTFFWEWRFCFWENQSFKVNFFNFAQYFCWN